MEGLDLLDFAGVARARHRLYPREMHLAEKLHAYSVQRKRPNTRVKDLPDMALLAQTGAFDARTLRAELQRTFLERGTHPLPSGLAEPPTDGWDKQYAQLSRVNRLPWPTLVEVLKTAREFLDPVLSGSDGTWSPASWAWRK